MRQSIARLAATDRPGSSAWRLGGLLVALVACVDDPPAEPGPEPPAGGICQIETHTFDTSDPTLELVPGTTIADLLERVAMVEVALTWTGWADDHLDPTPVVGSTTTLSIALLPETLTITLHDSAFDDHVCHDWIEVVGEAELATGDDILIGSDLFGVVYVNLHDQSAALKVSGFFDELGTTVPKRTA